jgi:hypothetical protein
MNAVAGRSVQVLTPEPKRKAKAKISKQYGRVSEE